jgi:hypothetical protein
LLLAALLVDALDTLLGWGLADGAGVLFGAADAAAGTFTDAAFDVAAGAVITGVAVCTLALGSGLGAGAGVGTTGITGCATGCVAGRGAGFGGSGGWAFALGCGGCGSCGAVGTAAAGGGAKLALNTVCTAGLRS